MCYKSLAVAHLPNWHTVLDAISLVSKQNKKGLTKQVNARLHRKMITDVPSSFKIMKQIIIKYSGRKWTPKALCSESFHLQKITFLHKYIYISQH